MRIGSIEPIVDLFADEVDTEGDDGDAKARGGVAELIGEHRMLPPCIPSPEELSSVFSTSRSHSILPSLPLSKPAMSSAAPVTELSDESDFESLLSPDGHISICGFGSLLSERSARSTFPDLANFRTARLNRFRRVFAHVAPVFFERGIAKPETMEISSLSVEPCEGETLVVTVFEIRKSEV